MAKAKGATKKRREKIEVAHKFLEIMDSPESVLLKGILYGLLFIANRRDGESIFCLFYLPNHRLFICFCREYIFIERESKLFFGGTAPLAPNTTL